MGLENRFLENRDIFLEVDVRFKAGLKTFNGHGVLNEADLISYNFNGVTKLLSFHNMLEDIRKEALKYDELVLTYKERGTKLLISANRKASP